MGGWIDAIVLCKPSDFDLPLLIRELWTQVRNCRDKGCSGQDRIPAHRCSLRLSLLFGMARLVVIQRPKSPDGPVSQGLNGQAMILGNLLQRSLNFLIREDSFSEFFDSWNKRVHVAS
jgi:hypothetical protein